MIFRSATLRAGAIAFPVVEVRELDGVVGDATSSAVFGKRRQQFPRSRWRVRLERMSQPQAEILHSMFEGTAGVRSYFTLTGARATPMRVAFAEPALRITYGREGASAVVELEQEVA